MATKRALHYIALGMAHRLAEEIDKDMGAGGGGGSAGLSLASFGAVPNDPEAADRNSEAFREGAPAAMEAGVKLVIPSGVFYVPEKILIPAVADLFIEGEPGAVVKGLPGDEYAGTDRPMIEIDGGSARPRLTVHNVTFDNSDRIFIEAEQSGTGLSLKRLDDVTITGCQFPGGALPENLNSGRGDSGVTAQQVRRLFIHDNYFLRQPDIGVYITGGGSAGPEDDDGETVITGNVFELCQVAASAKRQARNTVFSNNIVRYCHVGFTLFEASGLAPGRVCTVTGNIFEKLGTRAVDIRGSFGDTVANNSLTDWGYLPDGVTLSAGQQGMFFRGSEGASITGNTLGLKDWTNSNHYGIQFQSFDDPDNGTVQSRRNSVWGNRIFGVSRGINEIHGTTDNHGDNWISATVPIQFATGSQSTYGVMSTGGVRRYQASGSASMQINRMGATDGQLIRFERNGSNIGEVSSNSAGYAAFIGAPQLPQFTVATLPPATGRGRQLVFVTGEVGGATVAFSDGTNWRRVQDREIVS